MNSQAEIFPKGDDIKVYKYRWVILILFCIITVINFMQLMQFTIIADIVTKFYNVDTTAIDLTGLIFFVVYILLFLPISFLIEKYDLRITAIISTFFTLCGIVIKIFSDKPDKLYVAVIGQFFCAIGQTYMLSIPSKLATTWFGAKEVSTACALAVFGTQLGTALGAVIPPFVVQDSKNNEEISEGLRTMQLSYAMVAGASFILVCIFFRARPKLPPSQSQLMLLSQETEMNFLNDCKKVFHIKDFLIIIFVFGIFNGIWNSFGILINTLYIHYFPNGQTDVGIIVLIAIIVGGCIGNVLFGYILDKTHKFKIVSFFLMFTSFIVFIVVAYTLISKSGFATFFTIPLFGFFAASAMVVSYEFTLEATYPIPESVSCSVLNACMFFFAILASFGTELLLDLIDYLYSFLVLGIIMLCCSLSTIGISSRLRRREANLATFEGDAIVSPQDIR